MSTLSSVPLHLVTLVDLSSAVTSPTPAPAIVTTKALPLDDRDRIATASEPSSAISPCATTVVASSKSSSREQSDSSVDSASASSVSLTALVSPSATRSQLTFDSSSDGYFEWHLASQSVSYSKGFVYLFIFVLVDAYQFKYCFVLVFVLHSWCDLFGQQLDEVGSTLQSGWRRVFGSESDFDRAVSALQAIISRRQRTPQSSLQRLTHKVFMMQFVREPLNRIVDPPVLD